MSPPPRTGPDRGGDGRESRASAPAASIQRLRLDPQLGELRKGGVRVGLQEQSLKVLVELLERPGDLVTREQLRQRLWPNGTFVDFEHGLNAVINRLREALGDWPTRPASSRRCLGAATASLHQWTVRR